MTRSCVPHNSLICATWLISCWQHASFHIDDMSRSHVPHDSFTCGTWLIHMSNMPHFILATCPVHLFHMTRSHMPHYSFIQHVSFTYATLLIHSTWLVHMCHLTRSYMRHDSFKLATCPISYWRHASDPGWQSCMHTCLKLQASFCKQAINYSKALLLKMTCKDKASYTFSLPCIYVTGPDIDV